MLKAKTTKQQVMNHYDVVLYTGHEVSRITTGAPAYAYTAGTFGHNADIHDVTAFMPKDYRGTVALVDGDRPFGTHKIPYELIDKYCKKCQETEFYSKDYKTKMNRCLREMLKAVHKQVLSKDMER